MPASISPTLDELLTGLDDVEAPKPAEAARWPDVTPEFYTSNPFRQTGLRCLAGAREIEKRAEQLKLALELGPVASPWAFAPAAPLAWAEIQAATRTLENTPARLLHEFLWFWPENYPEDGPDEALDALAAGDPARAVAHWSTAASAGHDVAWHNLAVYHHRLALDGENAPGRDDDALGELWRQALHAWRQAAASETFWARLHARAAALDDAALAPDSVAQLRADFPTTLAQLNATLARQYAELGRLSRAALHVTLVAESFPDEPGRVAPLLEHAARPAAQRLTTRAEKTWRDVLISPSSGLRAATALVWESGLDLRLLEALGGTSSEFYREHIRVFTDAVLDAVVRYQRDTGDDDGCLPLLRHLLDLSVPPELAQRIDNAHTVIQANVLGKRPGAAPDARVTPNDHVRLIVETLIPGLDRLGLMGPARQAYAARLATWLKTIAVDFCRQEDELEWPLAVMAVALELPCEARLLQSLAMARNELERDFHIRRKKAVKFEVAGHTLLVNGHGLALNRRWVTTAAITGLRDGRISPEGKAAPRYLVAWRSAEAEFAIDETTLFSRPGTAVDDYARIIDAIYYFIAPPLIQRLTDALRAGQTVTVGPLQLDRTGVTLTSAGTRFFKRETAVPYARIAHRIQDHQLMVSDRENPQLMVTVDVMQTWNAVIIGHVIDQLARE